MRLQVATKAENLCNVLGTSDVHLVIYIKSYLVQQCWHWLVLGSPSFQFVVLVQLILSYKK